MTLPLSNGTWTLDPEHTVVGFAVQHLGISIIRGRFKDLEASVDVGDDLDHTSLAAVIEMASIDTGNDNRNTHVRSSDFFSNETHPKMTFTSTSITAGDDGPYVVAGDLSLNGHTQNEQLAVTFFGVEDNPFDGTHRGGFLATGKINRLDYGVDWQVPLASGGIMLGTDVDITIDAQLVSPS